MGQLLDFLLIGGVMSLVVWMVFGFIHMLLHIIGVWDKIAINIKLPKRKRYLTKVDPIYELCDSDWGGYCVKKWELGYEDEFGLQMLMVFMPYPIKLLRYKYINNNHIWLPDRTKIEEITEELGDMFERIWAVENKEALEKQRIKKEYQDNLDKLNKVFNENYEE